jgi:putative SOS response-associated peptidase YedK
VCGRVRLSSDVSDIKLVFSIPPHRPTSNTAPSWNVAPADPLPVVRYDARAGEPSLDVMRWDLVPFWAKDIKVGFSNVNAKAEGDRKQAGFPRGISASALPRTVNNFYEWKKWENRRSPADEWVRSFANVSTTPNELCVELHNWMPVVLGPEVWPVWLGEEPADLPRLKDLLHPIRPRR